MKKSIFIFFIICSFFNCNKEAKSIDRVVIIVIDGPRNIDLHSDSLSMYNSGFSKLKSQGIYFSNFYNTGTTNTQNGMSCILTGNSESLTNNGNEISDYPNIFHYYIENREISNDKTWIITSKDKLESLKNTTDLNYKSKSTAKTNSGINGLNSGYRHDSITYREAIEKLTINKPNLAFIAFREPDYSGHSGNWENYKLGIKNSLTYTQSIIDYINTNEYYSGRTLIIITNDHGRHLDGIADGFVSHGDNCEGCRHITLLAISPNLKSFVDPTYYNQNCIASTIAKILNFPMPTATSSFISTIY